ncbi:hypothetical protein N656DRAFT_777925 [Canariomyces notabilis]|uniref:DUF952 domain-containing protein n=1 Tax=Canariomyces notabilis TaxID=2074819 RepID=A0AAN6TG96_9PEZI|nr:hypothetical protein N656DRAFT_777925 [Canariomyces arenarius]
MAPLPPPSPLPKFVYKITPTAPPDPIPEQYPLSELDRQDGFVHLSAPWQIPITADLFFKDTPAFYILKLRLANFPASSVKWNEVDGTNGCPHLYGSFGAKDVVDVREFRREGSQSWREILEGEAWLE